MGKADKKLLIIQAAALSQATALAHPLDVGDVSFSPVATITPAVTCTVQASFRTASPPGEHGMIANGLYHRNLAKVMFWEQSSRQVAGERIWSEFRRAGGTVGMMFWQQSIGEDVDWILSPAPIHKHHGGMVDTCYAKPADLYERLCKAVGRPFKLRHYWGPMASTKAGDWIAAATTAAMDQPDCPDLLLTYLPTLDYDFQRFGPEDPRSLPAVAALTGQLRDMLAAAKRAGRDVLIFGDYEIAEVSQAVLPNVALMAAGLMAGRQVGRAIYPDLAASRAFAMADHEIAHVYVRDAADIPATAKLLGELPGVEKVLDRPAQQAIGLDHPNSGELVLLAQRSKWFAYPWWTDKRNAPDYAAHVDIHNKPGFDPCELFFARGGLPPLGVSQDTSRIAGSHGLAGAGRDVMWASTMTFPADPIDLIELARATGTWLNA